MKTYALSSPETIYLLKEYIKTFIATEVVFPHVLPRHWGQPFSPLELEAVYAGVKFIVSKAHPLQDGDLIETFSLIDRQDSLQLNWFLAEYWREVEAILQLYPTLTDGYQPANDTYSRIILRSKRSLRPVSDGRLPGRYRVSVH